MRSSSVSGEGRHLQSLAEKLAGAVLHGEAQLFDISHDAAGEHFHAPIEQKRRHDHAWAYEHGGCVLREVEQARRGLVDDGAATPSDASSKHHDLESSATLRRGSPRKSIVNWRFAPFRVVKLTPLPHSAST